jgi:hypothetical protein
VAERLAAWSHVELIPVATVVVNVFIENVLQHTACTPVLMLESNGEAVTISVQDDSSIPAARHEDPRRGGDWVSGLAIVASVCRAWGSTPDAVRKDGVGGRRDGKPALIRHLRYQQSVGVFGLDELAGHHHKRRI